MTTSTDQRILDHMRAAKFRPYLTVWALAIDLDLSRPTIRKALNRLEEGGMVERETRRVVTEDEQWSLTEQGRLI